MFNRRLSPEYYAFWRRAELQFGADVAAMELKSFGDGRSTAQFLEQFKKNDRAMTGLRSLLKESRGVTRVSTFTPDQLLAEVARLILSGELGIALRPREYQIGQSPQPVPPPPPQTAGPALGASSGSEPDPATFSNSLNALAQAAALHAAAASGAAFCPT